MNPLRESLHLQEDRKHFTSIFLSDGSRQPSQTFFGYLGNSILKRNTIDQYDIEPELKPNSRNFGNRQSPSIVMTRQKTIAELKERGDSRGSNNQSIEKTKTLLSQPFTPTVRSLKKTGTLIIQSKEKKSLPNIAGGSFPTKLRVQVPKQTLEETPSKPVRSFSGHKKNLNSREEDEDRSLLKFVIGDGNNSDLVRRVLLKRKNWAEIPSYSTIFNFAWYPTGGKIKFEIFKSSLGSRQMVNHFENFNELTSKSNLLKNLRSFSEETKSFLFDIIPTTYELDLDSENFSHELKSFLKILISRSSNFLIENQCLKALFSRDKGINNDSAPFGKKIYKDKSSSMFLYSQIRHHSSLNQGFNLWMLKPADKNRGRGIKLFNNLETFCEIIKDYENIEDLKASTTTALNSPNKQNARNRTGDELEINQLKEELKRSIAKFQGLNQRVRKFVIQKYVESPLLISRRKFDIRVWVLISHEMKVYFFSEGYIRTSSEKFELSETNINDPFVHLTNNAIQKNSENYGKYENGNQISFRQFERYLEKKYNTEFKSTILPRMKEIIVLTCQSVRTKINSNDRKNCFEIFGYDFFIDSNFYVWLIEVNTNPCIEQSSPLLSQLIPRMIDDAFRITIDNYFSPKHNHKAASKSETNDKNISKEESTGVDNTEALKKRSPFRVRGYADDTNLWELLTDISDQKYLNKRKLIK